MPPKRSNKKKKQKGKGKGKGDANKKKATPHAAANANTQDAIGATELMKAHGPYPGLDILIDQGGADSFLVGDVNQLLPDNFKAACEAKGQALTLRMQDGYDHSYYFIASFVDDHIAHHAKALLA